MADAGDIIAKVKVVYEPDGVKQAKEDLASLTDAAGSVGESAGSASEGLSSLGEQAGKAAASASELNSAFTDLPKIAEKSGAAFTAFGEGIAESRGAIDDMATSMEDVQAPLEKASSLMEKATAPMSAFSEHTQAISEGFTQMGESLTQASPLLMQYGDTLQAQRQALHEATPAFNTNDWMQGMNAAGVETWGTAMGDAATQMEVFQSALDNPKLAESAKATHQALGTMNANFQTVGKSASDASNAVGEFLGNSTSFDNGMMFPGGNGFGAIGGNTLEGPLEELKSFKPTSFGEAFSTGVSGVMGALNDIAMPIMAVQMIGMAVGQVSQGIYDMASVAEGQGAHSLGTFTGTVDALGQTAAKVGQQFSENFGQAITPTLQQMNYEMSQNQSSGGIGGMLGEGGQFLFNSFRVLSGLDVQGGLQGFANQYAADNGQPLPYQGPGPQSQAATYEQKQMDQLPQTVAMQTAQAHMQYATMLADAVNPTYLASQDQLQSAQRFLQHAQQSYNISNPISQAQLQSDALYDSYMSGSRQDLTSPDSVFASHYAPGNAPRTYTGGTSGAPYQSVAQAMGLPFANPLADFLGGIGGFLSGFGGGGGADFANATCFPAGTRVLMADGSERAIETLQVGDRVLGHERASFTPTTVLALITPPPKKVYELTFDDGKTLTLTDSHPISTAEGWKSLHPRATKEENPDLAVSTLHIGDRVHTTGGMVTLTGILPREVVQIYNITVDEPHTFYANGVLVHNKVLGASASGSTQMDLGAQIMQSIGDISLPHMNMQGSNLVSSLASNFSAADLSHTFTATVNWIASGGLEHTFEGIANWIASGGLEHTFEGIANWIASGDLAHTFEGIVNWIASGGLEHTFEGVVNWLASGGLEHTFEGIVNWLASGGLEHTFEGIVSWIASGGLEHTFEGIVSWIGQNLEHTFTGVANWIGQNLSQTFTAVASWIPGFASGVQNFSGGLAVVGENGPELLQLPQGSSVYPMSDSSSGTAAAPPLLGNTGSGGAPQSFNISLHMDSQTLIAAMGIPLSQNVRLTSGMRSF